jgi:hypothetical protein
MDGFIVVCNDIATAPVRHLLRAVARMRHGTFHGTAHWRRHAAHGVTHHAVVGAPQLARIVTGAACRRVAIASLITAAGVGVPALHNVAPSHSMVSSVGDPAVPDLALVGARDPGGDPVGDPGDPGSAQQSRVATLLADPGTGLPSAAALVPAPLAQATPALQPSNIVTPASVQPVPATLTPVQAQTVGSVPEPGSVLMFGSALACLLGILAYGRWRAAARRRPG